MTDRLPLNMRAKITETECPVPDVEGPCWSWTGAVTSRGYGSVGHEGRTWSTHKLAYVLIVGPVPAGLQIDHLCRNKVCCNPTHLEPVTGKENVRRWRRDVWTPAVIASMYDTVARRNKSAVVA